jgi:anti-sigma regulatory factor (Ser/Thr protein kinase)
MSRVSTHLPRRRDCAGIARRWVEQNVGAELDRGTLSDLQLLVTELVNNAYLHGEGQITVFIDPVPEAIRVEVVDQGTGAALEICEQKEFGPGGQGLRLVEALSDRWGAFEGTTHVWADLPRRS